MITTMSSTTWTVIFTNVRLIVSKVAAAGASASVPRLKLCGSQLEPMCGKLVCLPPRAGGDRVQALHVFDEVSSWARTLRVERLATPFEG